MKSSVSVLLSLAEKKQSSLLVPLTLSFSISLLVVPIALLFPYIYFVFILGLTLFHSVWYDFDNSLCLVASTFIFNLFLAAKFCSVIFSLLPILHFPLQDYDVFLAQRDMKTLYIIFNFKHMVFYDYSLVHCFVI